MPMRQNVSSDLRHDLFLVTELMNMEDCAVPMSQSVSSDLRHDLPRRGGGGGDRTKCGASSSSTKLEGLKLAFVWVR